MRNSPNRTGNTMIGYYSISLSNCVINLIQMDLALVSNLLSESMYNNQVEICLLTDGSN